MQGQLLAPDAPGEIKQIPQTVLALRGSHGVGIEGPWMVGGSVHGHARSFLLLFTVLGDTYPQKHTVKHSVTKSNTEKYTAFNKFSGPGPFFGRKKTPEAAAGHDNLVLRTKTLLASMAHECTERTSRRAEVPPPEEAALRAAPQRGAAAPLCGLLWWRNLSPPAYPVRTLMRHAG